jgi:hypothetical protein
MEVRHLSYGIVRVHKFMAGSVKGIEIHDRRDKNASHSNPDIDFGKSMNNYSVFQQDKSFYVASKERIGQLGLKKAVRKDAVVMAQVLVTSDNSFFGGLDGGQQKKFFEDSFRFLADRYGEKNIVSATVHLDERTPHMHFNFVPVTEDGRLCAKEVLSRQNLISQQDRFFDEVGRAWGLMRGEAKDKGKRRRHLETDEYKKVMARIEYEKGNLRGILAEKEATTAAVRGALKNKNEIEEKIVTLRTEKNILEKHQVKGAESRAVRVPGGYLSKVKDFEGLCGTAALAESFRKESAKWQSMYSEAMKENKRLEDNAEKTKNSMELKLRAAEKELKETKSGRDSLAKALVVIAGERPVSEVREMMTDGQFRLFSHLLQKNSPEKEKGSGLSP